MIYLKTFDPKKGEENKRKKHEDEKLDRTYLKWIKLAVFVLPRKQLLVVRYV